MHFDEYAVQKIVAIYLQVCTKEFHYIMIREKLFTTYFKYVKLFYME